MTHPSDQPVVWSRRTGKVSDVVAMRIVQDIVARALPPGSRLPGEPAMMQQYQVSRSSLREALRILEVEGLIAVKTGPGGGPVVRKVSSRDYGRMSSLFFQMEQARLADLVAARQVIEPVLARLAAEVRSEADCARLASVVEAGQCPPTGETPDSAVAITEFHEVVVDLAGNPVLGLYANALKHIFTDRVVGRVFPPESQDRARDAHARIAAAIVAGDGAKAEQSMREHLADFACSYRQNYPGLLDEVVSWAI
ncbi:FadR/GntR family transcriptional regulator [Micromonospora cathayae]|uniref:FadR/GntR family transcriptional regulator n=1 Tax=Micromonospora cathayae TaxID=3028804 RepID=A0ABY7ZLH2_9ACTN|nr:FadR/GntR family transcriptional regulator [Micromonospora sp. HUAS 3]WDZ83800.1 FadR/GntR family transcriptional regulator [Micromonospora sp. HUAS 3]